MSTDASEVALMYPPTLPAALGRLVEEHGSAYAPQYPPDNNADHGPMACLAMHGLGLDLERIAQFATHYQRRLAPQKPPVEALTEANWQRFVGRRDAYSGVRAYFLGQIALLGWQGVVAQHLPLLVSGWVKDAFHPLIRLAYGIEFELPSEIASGLAYLSTVGNDPELAAAAERSPQLGDVRTYLASLQTSRSASFLEGRFNARYRAALRVVALCPAAGSAEEILRALSRSALEVFHSTHDFFALHLVTASHAFRVCSPWAGPNGSALFSVGLGAAYLAIGAPPFAALPRAAAELPLKLLAVDDDEHDIKIAYSALMQSRVLDDPTYRWVAAQYLNGRDPAAS
jgi:hypothetical protein